MIKQRENLVSNEIKLSIKIDDNGSLSIVGKEAKKTSDSLGNLDKTTNKAAKSQGTLDRNLKGTANMTSNGTKQFSKMSQGISGGLVPAYAILASNIFALTAAFGALQRAAQVEQLEAGLRSMGTASGIALKTLSEGLRETTGNGFTTRSLIRVAKHEFDSR